MSYLGSTFPVAAAAAAADVHHAVGAAPQLQAAALRN